MDRFQRNAESGATPRGGRIGAFRGQLWIPRRCIWLLRRLRRQSRRSRRHVLRLLGRRIGTERGAGGGRGADASRTVVLTGGPLKRAVRSMGRGSFPRRFDFMGAGVASRPRPPAPPSSLAPASDARDERRGLSRRPRRGQAHSTFLPLDPMRHIGGGRGRKAGHRPRSCGNWIW